MTGRESSVHSTSGRGTVIMLAYVFWHWAQQGASGYESALARFHRRLAEDPPAGYAGSFAFRLAGQPPGIDSAGATYEDWYLLDDFAALGVLNESAVSAANRAAHDDVARAAVGAAGGVYRLRAGPPMPAAVRCATWFSKPRGIAYAEFYRAVPATAIAAGASLWERQMNLGPALECCLLAEDPLAVDGALDIAVVPLTLVYAPD